MDKCSCPVVSPLLLLCPSTPQPCGVSHLQQLPGFFPALNASKAISWRCAPFAIQELGCSRASLLLSPSEFWHSPTPGQVSCEQPDAAFTLIVQQHL